MAATRALVLTIGLICALSLFKLAEAMERCDYERVEFDCKNVKKAVWEKFDVSLPNLSEDCIQHMQYCVNDADGDKVEAAKAYKNHKPRPPMGSRPKKGG